MIISLQELFIYLFYKFITRNGYYSKETSALWNAMEGKGVEFGLNEWGRFLLTKTIADELFENDDDKVLFCFYI